MDYHEHDNLGLY